MLFRSNHHIIDWAPMIITPLYSSCSRLPNLDCTIFTTGNHPLPFTVEGNAGDVVGVAFECEDRVGVCGFDVVELDVGVGGGSEETLIGGDAKPVDLRVGVLNCAGADA